MKLFGKTTLTLAREILSYLPIILASDSQRRHVHRWLRSLIQENYLLREKVPWITFDALDYLKERLFWKPRVFEYGSGGSTLHWLRFGATCVSIEHDPEWFALTRDRLSHVDEVDYRLVLPEKVVGPRSPDITDPALYLSAVPLFQGYSFKRYVSQIDGFPDCFFDLVMIDGRARPSCIMHGARKVKKGGMMILDNADRVYYTAKTQQYLGDFTCSSFHGVGPCGRRMWRTDIYLKKA
jgi:hypothetical protein